MKKENRKIIITGAALAIILSVLAPFIASSNPDGLDMNIINLIGGGSKEKADQIAGEKDSVGYKAPFSDYSITGMGKEGEVISILIGTVIMLVLGLGLSFLKKKKKGLEQD